ncbi:MAG: LmbE family protein [Parcubacteria group bacterium Gr01-1014_33]|nr:MAG: LmbE family protein [Parcubacteria group bacterium Gr01-1014_33]
MNHPFLGKKLLIITAHPDDESFGMGGTIYKNNKAGGKTAVICATLGEKGSSHLKVPATEAELKQIRKKEIENATHYMGVEKLFLLNLPDGKLHLKKYTSLFSRKAFAIASHQKPDAILSFGAYGMSGHLDHITAYRVAKRIAKRFRVPLFTLTIPPALVNDFIARIHLRRKSPHYTKQKPFFETPTTKIPIDPKIKIRVGKFHISQLGGKPPFSAFPPKLRRERLKAEWFAG